MNVKLLTKHHLEFLSLKGGYTCSSESTLVKMPHGGNHMSRFNYIECQCSAPAVFLMSCNAYIALIAVCNSNG